MMVIVTLCTGEPRHNEDLCTMKITLLYQVSPLYQDKKISPYIGGKKKTTGKQYKELGPYQQNYLVIRGFCYIRPLYNETPL